MSTPSDAEQSGIARLIEEQREPAGKLSAPVTIGTSPETETFADPKRGENGETAEEGTEDQPSRQRSFGSLSPAEAGRRSAQARRERALLRDSEAAAASDGRVLLVRTPVQIGDIIANLAVRAKKGDTGAARELRAYLAEYPAEDSTDVSALDKRTRQQVLAKLLAEIEEDEGEAEPSSTLDGGDATPAGVGVPR